MKNQITSNFMVFVRAMKISIIALTVFFFSGCNSDEGFKLYEEAVHAWKVGNYDDAVQNLIALTKFQKNHPLVDDALFLVAGIYLEYLNEPNNAVRYYRILGKSYKDSEYYLPSMLRLADIYEGDTNEPEKAISVLQELFSVEDPELHARLYSRIGNIQMLNGNYHEARKYFKNLIVKLPDSDYVPQAYYFIGIAFYHDKMLKLAELTFNEAIEKLGVSPKSVNSIIGLANIYQESKKLNKALELYEIVLGLTTNSADENMIRNQIDNLKNRLKKTKF